jgi:hypothetical protein
MTFTIEIYISNASKAFRLTLEDDAIVQDIIDYFPNEYMLYDEYEEFITKGGTCIKFLDVTDSRVLHAIIDESSRPLSPLDIDDCGCYCSAQCVDINVDDCGCACNCCYDNKIKKLLDK